MFDTFFIISIANILSLFFKTTFLKDAINLIVSSCPSISKCFSINPLI